MNKKIKTLHAQWVELEQKSKTAQQYAELCSNDAQNAAKILQDAISFEMSELQALLPETTPEVVAEEEKTWTVAEIAQLLDVSIETVKQNWPHMSWYASATTSELNQVLARLGRSPIEDYL